MTAIHLVKTVAFDLQVMREMISMRLDGMLNFGVWLEFVPSQYRGIAEKVALEEFEKRVGMGATKKRIDDLLAEIGSRCVLEIRLRAESAYR